VPRPRRIIIADVIVGWHSSIVVDISRRVPPAAIVAIANTAAATTDDARSNWTRFRSPFVRARRIRNS
jgi:hypothetical protein